MPPKSARSFRTRTRQRLSLGFPQTNRPRITRIGTDGSRTFVGGFYPCKSALSVVKNSAANATTTGSRSGLPILQLPTTKFLRAGNCSAPDNDGRSPRRSDNGRASMRASRIPRRIADRRECTREAAHGSIRSVFQFAAQSAGPSQHTHPRNPNSSGCNGEACSHAPSHRGTHPRTRCKSARTSPAR